MKRLLTGLFCAVVFIGIASFLPTGFEWLWAAIFLLALTEGLTVAGLSGIERIYFLFSGFFLLYTAEAVFVNAEIRYLVIIGAILIALNKNDLFPALERLSLGFFLLMYFSLMSCGSELYYRLGAAKFIWLFSFLWCYDIFAFYFGCSFGRHKICPRISPKKSWEGFIAGLSGTFIVEFAVASHFFGTGVFTVSVLAIIASVIGHTGDIFESAWKRRANLKDSSSILPGHGGVWDRIDGAILVLPAFLFVMQYFEI
ncbi:MAG: phosphatidate cytidylyltransferase [Candidatus Wallbacteria bacterium]|nr:phosphatidate cytidylyltransferase [Candidatus Wallbacteria bacterium]